MSPQCRGWGSHSAPRGVQGHPTQGHSRVGGSWGHIWRVPRHGAVSPGVDLCTHTCVSQVGGMQGTPCTLVHDVTFMVPRPPGDPKTGTLSPALLQWMGWGSLGSPFDLLAPTAVYFLPPQVFPQVFPQMQPELPEERRESPGYAALPGGHRDRELRELPERVEGN